MKIHRFIDNFDLSKPELEITGEISKQMALVLKLKVGEKIELSDGTHISAIAYICKIDKKSVLVKIEKINKILKNEKKVHLFCAVLKKENFELVAQKATECGVSKIIPIITERTIKTGINIERLQKIAKEASEQSGRMTVPEISEPIKFLEALETIEGDSVLFDISGSEFTNNYQLKTKNLFIGPEGGWTKKEIELAKQNNFKIATLGPLTLRGETATIIATYLVSNIK